MTIASFLYKAYCQEKGGISPNGKKLPPWESIPDRLQLEMEVELRRVTGISITLLLPAQLVEGHEFLDERTQTTVPNI